MISFTEEERKVTITMSGDKEEYIETLQAMLFMMANQNQHNPLNVTQVALISNLISAMLPDCSCLR